HRSLSHNSLTGSIPNRISNLSPLVYLSLAKNNLTGPIPNSISKLDRLTYVSLASNDLTGPIPNSISMLSQLTYLNLSSNSLSGPVVCDFDSRNRIEYLNFAANNLSGYIPASIQDRTSLEFLSLSNNILTGPIPNGISMLAQLTHLSLANNILTGPIPNGISMLSWLTYLDIHGNRLDGSLPSSLSSLINLVTLDLSSNSLSGSMLSDLVVLERLTYLNLSATNLRGQIPPEIGGLTSLQYFDISGTSLVCPPDHSACATPQSPNTSFCGTCGSFCKTCSQSAAGGVSVGAIIGIVVGAVVLLLLLGATLLYFRHKIKLKPQGPSSSLAALHCTEFSIEEVLTATNDWSPTNQLGSGAFGDVYKGVSPRDGAVWAVKRARLIDVDFQNEIQQMADKNHPNIVTLLGFAIGGDLRTRPEQVLIYEYVPNGDLHKWIGPSSCAAPPVRFLLRHSCCATHAAPPMLRHSSSPIHALPPIPRHPSLATHPPPPFPCHPSPAPHALPLMLCPSCSAPHALPLMLCLPCSAPHALPLMLCCPFLAEAERPLALKERLDILIGLARGFEYLHSFGIVLCIVHRDIKPDNVLITHNMQAKIADFGLLRMGEGTNVGTTRIMGTPGYVDPVYSITCKATTASDVYSFGVLMLVVLTGRPPISETAGESRKITPWAAECVSANDVGSLVDATMDAPADAVMRVAHIALACTGERTADRPSMLQIANELQAIREEVAGKEVQCAAAKVDAQVQEMKDVVAGVSSLDTEIKKIGELSY
ncbi:unnamed protein product, partial [Closterium sp. Yama58-4]